MITLTVITLSKFDYNGLSLKEYGSVNVIIRLLLSDMARSKVITISGQLYGRVKYLKNRATERQRQKDRKTERQRDRKTERQKDRKTERQKDRKTDKQKDRKTKNDLCYQTVKRFFSLRTKLNRKKKKLFSLFPKNCNSYLIG